MSEEQRVIYSPDGDCPGKFYGSEAQRRCVTKIVLDGRSEGDRGGYRDKNAGSSESFIDRLRYWLSLSSLQQNFPNLTHLHVWKVEKLRELTNLPQGLIALDVQDCEDLESIESLPAPKLDTLVLDGCSKLAQLGLQKNGSSGFAKLRDLSLQSCVQLPQSDVQALLNTATTLRFLNFSGCSQLASVGSTWPSSGLVDIRLSDCTLLRSVPKEWPPALRRLELKSAAKLSGLPPLPARLDYLSLAYTTSLQRLPTLQGVADGWPRTLYLYGSSVALNPDLLGEDEETNVADAVRAHLLDARYGLEPDNEVKVILLGNGRSGKSSLARRWIENTFDPKESSTHGIRLWKKTVEFVPVDAEEGQPEIALLNVWDFAGQDLYHNTHRLFLQSRAIFIVCDAGHHGNGSDLDTDAEEVQRQQLELEPDVHRDVGYWKEQVASLGNMSGRTEPPPLLVVRTKVDRDDENTAESRVGGLTTDGSQFDFSAASGMNVDKLEGWICEQTSIVLGRKEARSLPPSAHAIKAALKALFMNGNDDTWIRRELTRDSSIPIPSPTLPVSGSNGFDALLEQHLAADSAYRSYPGELIRRFHRSGFIYWSEKMPDQIFLDQRWAIDAIYAFSARDRHNNAREYLARSRGQFTPSRMASLVWNQLGLTQARQQLVLQFMEACGMTFLLLDADEAVAGEPVYQLPGFLPRGGDALMRASGAWPQPDSSWAEIVIAGTSEADMVSVVSKFGQALGRSALLWRWGCAFSSADRKSAVQMDWSVQEQSYLGQLVLRFSNVEDTDFLSTIRDELHIGLGRVVMDVNWPLRDEGSGSTFEPKTARLRLQGHAAQVVIQGSEVTPARRSRSLKYVTFSFAGADADNPGIADLPKALAKCLRGQLDPAVVQVMSYDNPEGDERLRMFQDNLAKGDLVLVFWSRRYWFSEYCMYELMKIYEHPPRGRFPRGLVSIFAFPQSRFSNNGSLTTAAWEKFWEDAAINRDLQARKEADGTVTRIKELLRRQVTHDWYEFFTTRPDRECFITAVLETMNQQPLPDPSDSDRVGAVCAELVEQIKRLLQEPDQLLKLAKQTWDLDKGHDEALSLLVAACMRQRDSRPNSLIEFLDGLKERATLPEELIELARREISLQ